MGADPLAFAQALIRCRSVTPADDGAMALVDREAVRLGFSVRRLDAGGTSNLFAWIGQGAPHFCFAGHTDVVPAGGAWRADPFGGAVTDGALFGRGACDMKGAIAAFLAAVEARLAAGAPRGTISLAITGDEEGEAVDGTRHIVGWMREAGVRPDFCLVGEPTCRARLGDTVKIGRRGSLNASVTVQGVQGHVAYPDLAENPVHRLVAALGDMAGAVLDDGSAWFAPSSLQITSVDVGNAARNVIPGEAAARLNIRFNDRQSAAGLEAWLRAAVARHATRFTLTVSCGAEPFLTVPGEGTGKLARAVARATGVSPALETGGGTSDARFLAPLCPVAEFGLVGATMHKADECVPVAELRALAGAYREILAEFGA